MATFGMPADSFAQSAIVAREELAPTAPVPPERAAARSASSLSVPHDKAARWEAPAVTVLPVREAA
jgi:hypothetical protein